MQKKSFVKIGTIYAIGQILSKLITFILLPIYTRQLGTTEFGRLNLVDTVLEFINVFIIISIYSGYIRFYSEYNDSEKKQLRNTAVTFSLIMIIIHITILYTVGPFISGKIFKFGNSYEILKLVIFRGIVTQFIALLTCDYTLNYKAEKAVLVNLINLILNISFIIYFVVMKKQGIEGIYKGYIISNLIMVLILAYFNLKDYKLALNLGMLKNMLKFSGGLIPSSLSATILNLSDRYFLAGYKSEAETGIYSTAYKFGMLIEPTFVTPFNQIFTPYRFEVWQQEDAEEKFNKFFFYYHFIGCFIMLGICIYSRIAITILTTPEYYNAYKLVPLIIIAYFLYGKSAFYCLGIQLKNKMYLHGIIMLISGFINIFLNIFMIPIYGMTGAALSTVISYLIMNFIYKKVAMPLYHVKYHYKKIIKIYVITLILYLAYLFISIINNNLIIEFIINIPIIMAYVFFSVIFKIISKNEINNYVVIIKGKLLKK